MVKSEIVNKTKITGERVEIILKNPDLPNSKLSEMTDGLSCPVIEIIKDVDKKGLRGKQSR